MPGWIYQRTHYDVAPRWKDYYQGSLFKKQDLTRAWLALPKYVCWKIWIARNKGLFENLSPSPDKVSSFAKALWIEALLSNGLRHLHIEPLNSKDKIWTIDLLRHLKTALIDVKKPNHSRWQIRKNPETSRNIFPGALEGNPTIMQSG